MKKKIAIINILAAAIIILATITPVVYAENLNIEKKVNIITTIYQFFDKREIVTEVFEKEAQEIKEDLEHLQKAFIEGNKQSIEKYESILIDKGIFGENHKIFSKKSIINAFHEKYFSIRSNSPLSLINENSMCLVNAKGKGNLTFMFDETFKSIAAGGVVLLLLCALLPPLIAILGLPMLILLLGGLGGLILAHLRPFRILNPTLEMHLKTGDCSINGLNGSQQFPAPLDANFYWFTGITVNFYTNDPDVFLLIFALKSEVL